MKLSRKQKRKTKKKMKNKKGGMLPSSSTRSSRASVRGSRTSANRSSASVNRPVAAKSSRRAKLAPIAENSLRRRSLKNEDVHVLSDKMHWIMDLAGSEDIMDEIALTYGGFNVVLDFGPSIPAEGDYNETMYFYDGGKSGHWIYFEKMGFIC